MILHKFINSCARKLAWAGYSSRRQVKYLKTGALWSNLAQVRKILLRQDFTYTHNMLASFEQELHTQVSFTENNFKKMKRGHFSQIQKPFVLLNPCEFFSLPITKSQVFLIQIPNFLLNMCHVSVLASIVCFDSYLKLLLIDFDYNFLVV